MFVNPFDWEYTDEMLNAEWKTVCNLLDVDRFTISLEQKLDAVWPKIECYQSSMLMYIRIDTDKGSKNNVNKTQFEMADLPNHK